jgi:thiol-disulfide isomerase/thioredoxin
MKSVVFSPLRAALCRAALALAALTPLSAADPLTADAAFEAARNAINSRTPDGGQVLDAGFAFFLAYPEDRRTNGLLPAMAGIAMRLPQAEREVYTKTYHDRIAAALAKPDLPDAAREGILAAVASTEVSTQTRATTPDVAAVRAKIDALAARYPQSKSLAGLDLGYAKLLAKTDAAAGEAFLKKLAASPDAETARQAGGELRVAQMRTKPLEMKFTAADGREVDFAKLRGKVVLIDFWATWCGPCIAELPNLTRVYNTYHDKGFEVVGISFENSSVIDEAALKNPRNAGKALDTPEQVAEKLKAAKEKMLKFTAEKSMPWPQHFDGKYWENEYGRMYNIRGIPAMFLLDKEGKLVETSARGEKLEPLVKKLLGLDS